MTQDEAYGFTSTLRGFGEVRLEQAMANSVSILRYLSSGDFGVTVIRIERLGSGEVRLVAKSAAGGLPGCAHPSKGCTSERRLSGAEIARLDAVLAPLAVTPSYGCYYTPDLTYEVVELMDERGRRHWHELSPTEGDLHDLAVMLRELAAPSGSDHPTV